MIVFQDPGTNVHEKYVDKVPKRCIKYKSVTSDPLASETHRIHQLQYYETREDFQCMSTIDLSEVSDQTIIIETEILSSGRLRCCRTPLSLQTPRKLKPESAEDASSVSEARRQRYPGLTCSPRLL